jgi:hypothetical protein
MDSGNIVSRTHAQSGRVDYSKPTVIRGGANKPTYLEVVPTFVPRSNGAEDLCLKLSYWKKTQGNFRVGYPAEFTLTHDEVLALRDLIERGLSMVGKESDTNYLLVPLDDASQTNLEGRDAGAVGRALLDVLNHQEVVTAIAALPDATSLLEGLQLASRIQLLEMAINELEDNLDNSVADEAVYQKWCEQNAWAFGNAYAMRDEVRAIALGDSVDLLFARTADQLRDIFELKRPDHNVLGYDSTHKNHYWSPEVSRTIGQCHRYLDALHDAARNGLRDHPELIAYYPYATIVIGRSSDWEETKLRDLHGLNMRLHGIRVMTYDHLLAQAKRTLEVLRDSEDRDN